MKGGRWLNNKIDGFFGCLIKLSLQARLKQQVLRFAQDDKVVERMMWTWWV
jgi:hypothetical protein